MRKLEKVLIILIVIATISKLVPVVGMSIVLTFAALSLSFLYFIFGFAVFTKIAFANIFKRETYKHLKVRDIIISVLTGFAFPVLISGLLFRLNYWPAAHIMSFTGLLTTFPFIIIALVLLHTQNRFVYIEILKRGIPLYLFVLLLHLLPLTTRLKIFKVSNPEHEREIINNYNSYR